MNKSFTAKHKDRLRCHSCGWARFSAKIMTCPYAEDVHNEIVIVVLCSECEQEAIDDI